MSKDIEAHFEMTHQILSPTSLLQFLKWLNDISEGRWRPERYNSAEPVRYPYSPIRITEVVDKWIKENIGMILKRLSPPKYEMDFTGQRNRLLVKNQLTIYLDTMLFKESQSVDGCLEFLNALYAVLRPVWGYSVHRKDYLAKNLQITYRDEGNVSRVETWLGRDLSKCLSGIYWANWFSPAYVEFFGRERLESAPCFKKKCLPDGGYLILTASTPMEFGTSETKHVEHALREHLGADAFFDIRMPHRPMRSPWNSKFVS